MEFKQLNEKAQHFRCDLALLALGFGQLVQVLHNVTFAQGKHVGFVGRFEPATQTCSCCGRKQKLELRERVFHCQQCGLSIGRDHNAAINIHRVGASTLGLEVVRPATKAALFEAERSPSL